MKRFKKSIEHYMTKTPQTIGREQSLEQAKSMMSELGVRHLPVLEHGKVIGIISDRDIRFAESISKQDAKDLVCDDALSPDPFQVAPDTTLETVVRTMAEQKLGSALIVENGHVLGIFTTVDALNLLADLSK